jgi:hypothetical protein
MSHLFEFVFRNLPESSTNLGQGYGKTDMTVDTAAGIPFGSFFDTSTRPRRWLGLRSFRSRAAMV